MALDFNEVYFYRTSDGIETIALGVRNRPGEEPKGFQFLVPTLQEGGRGGREILGEITDELAGGLVVVRDSVHQDDEGRPVEHLFSPLTMDDWRRLQVHAADEIGLGVQTDHDLREFYRQSFLDDWWDEKPGTAPSAGG